MPELPEVETVRRDLAARVVGRPIGAVEVTGARTVRRTSATLVAEGLRGRTIVRAGRRGKYLLLPLDSGALLIVHLRMSGRLLLAPVAAARPRHTHVALSLGPRSSEGGDGGAGVDELRFVDPRTFGEVIVADPARLDVEVPGVDRLGPDAWDDVVSWSDLAAVLTPRSGALKPLLTDQHALAGLGNIYTDEVLHRARLSPWRSASSLDRGELRTLFCSLRSVLGEAIEARGSTLADAQYVDLGGLAGSFQDRHRVYGRGGQRCLRCRRTVERVRWGGRSTFWCPGCQR